MPKASELKRGAVVEIDGQVYVVRQVEAKSPSARGASTLYKVRFSNVQTKQKLDESFKGDDLVKDADFERRAVQLSYRDTDQLHFMDNEDYTQYSLNVEDLEEQTPFLTDGLEGLLVLLVDGNPVAVELPASVNLEVVDTSPAIKGATAAARNKPAVLSTGLEVQVPEYLENGELVKVNTATGKYMSRA